MSAESGEERGDCFLLWRKDVVSILKMKPDARHAFIDALLTWFSTGETVPLEDPFDWFLERLAEEQKEAAARWARKKEAQSAGGRKGMERRWKNKPITTDKLVINKTKRNETQLNQTERNETGTPQAATVSPPFSDDLVLPVAAHGAPYNAAIDAAIVDAAQLLGDGLPSRDKWRRFMLAHGVAAFRETVTEVAGKAGIANKGAYLNTLLDAYGTNQDVGGVSPEVMAALEMGARAGRHPYPPAPAPKPRTFTPRDWGLCRERCANFNAETATCPYSRIPPEHAANPHPPEECPHFKRCADYGENTPRMNIAALAAGIGNPVPRTVRESV